MRTELLDYRDGELTSEGYLAYDDSTAAARPAVLVFHTWGGQSGFEREKAERLARLGYAGFAVDLYGKGNRGTTPEVSASLMQPLMEDRGLLRGRLLAAVRTVQGLPVCDGRVAAIGYCFGGLCALDLARAGDERVMGVASLHGLLHAPKLGPQGPIIAKVLILHGYNDPMAPPEAVLEVAREMTEAGADWQLHAYGGTVHGFSNPSAKAPERGIVYSPVADRRSWAAVIDFLREVLP